MNAGPQIAALPFCGVPACDSVRRLALLVLSLLLAVAPDTVSATDPSADPSRAVTAPPNEASTLTDADRAFLHYAIDHGRMSGHANAIARKRAAWPALRALAGTMLAEQRALTGSLLALAGRDLPAAEARGKTHADLLALVESDPVTFDHDYLRLLLVNQREAVSRYRTASEDPALSAAVRTFARDALPLVELHLERARDTDRMLAELD